MRYTKKFIEARFAMAMDACGLPHGETYSKRDDGTTKANVGVYFIDNYYGWQIRKMHNEGGAESHAFGSERRNAREFVALLTGIIETANLLKQR
jgi:hypothetical protein